MDLVVLVDGPRDGRVYYAAELGAFGDGYIDTGRSATLAELFPRRYKNEPTRDDPHRVWKHQETTS